MKIGFHDPDGDGFPHEVIPSPEVHDPVGSRSSGHVPLAVPADAFDQNRFGASLERAVPFEGVLLLELLEALQALLLDPLRNPAVQRDSRRSFPL